LDDIISLSARVSELAAERGERPAVTDQHRTVTWAELHRRTNRIARGLEAAGVKQGDLVTVGLPNSVDFVEACYALWKIGATPQPISYRLPTAEAEAVMALAETPILIAGPTIERRPPAIRHRRPAGAGG
jgi:bile acid-coenzyme A ligase